MRLKRILISFCLTLTSIISYSQILTDEERKLYNIIMQYRKEKGLPDISLSTSLTYVAQTHVRDLANNKPDIGNCNAHSWSSNGNWTPCCYTPDHAQAECMWSKPRELTTYIGNGFEIASWTSGQMTSKTALELWKQSPDHNAVIINQGIWEDEWNAIGIGLFKGYAVVWFGNEIDKE
jgi:uncharacterized protein YkwD